MQGTLIGGLIVGLLFGFLLQRSRMCFNSAIRDVRYFKDNWLWKQGLMAIAVETIGFQLMAALGVIKLNPSAFIPAAQIVGGFAFGMMDIRPDYANLKVGDEIRKVSPEEVAYNVQIVVQGISFHFAPPSCFDCTNSERFKRKQDFLLTRLLKEV